jgi:sialate O-acetylesterase
MLPGLIANWRADWGREDFPFYYVQLALIAGRPTWAILRDAQVSTLDVTSNTAMACIIDVPTIPTSEIHPKDKEPAGERLALAARALIYGETNLPYSGPIRDISKSFINGSKIVVGFNHTDGGLVTDDGSLPDPFMIAGADGIYYSATAQIVGDTVEVSSPAVLNPRAVRYCWGSYPLCNLFNNYGNGYGLPASPFQLTLP